MALTQQDREAMEDPSTTSAEYDKMVSRWDIVNALLGGTEAMRVAGEQFLPPHTNESRDAYFERLERATLLNMLELTLTQWVGKPFGKPVKFNDGVPEQIQEFETDIDLQGTDVAVFLRRWFANGLTHGHSHVLVEFPRVEARVNDDGESITRTYADDLREGLRPYWVPIRPENVIFMFAETLDGRELLTHVRIREEVTERMGFIAVTKQRIRILEPGLVEIWELQDSQSRKQKWAMVDSYPTGLNFIPLVTFYANREGLMLSKSPLLDLAYLNVEHWQSKSDQRSILTVTRFPMLALSGGTDDDGELTVGPNNWLFTPDPQGRFYYVEHTGAAIEAGRNDLHDLEDQMAHYGAQFLRKRPGTETATARALDAAEATCPLQDVTFQFIEAVNLALFYTALWLKLDDGGTIDITTEFGFEGGSGEDLKFLTELRKNRDIARVSIVAEAKRRGVLPGNFDLEADAELLDQEAAKMADTLMDLDPSQVDINVRGNQL